MTAQRAQRLFVECGEIRAFQQYLTLRNRREPHDGARQARLAATRLSNQPYRFASADIERHAIHRVQQRLVVPLRIAHMQVTYGKQLRRIFSEWCVRRFPGSVQPGTRRAWHHCKSALTARLLLRGCLL